MSDSITIDELQSSARDLLDRLSRGGRAVAIEEQGTVVGILISPAEYATLSQQRAQRAVAVLKQFHDAIAASGATEEELRELEKELLERKAS